MVISWYENSRRQVLEGETLALACPDVMRRRQIIDNWYETRGVKFPPSIEPPAFPIITDEEIEERMTDTPKPKLTRPPLMLSHYAQGRNSHCLAAA